MSDGAVIPASCVAVFVFVFWQRLLGVSKSRWILSLHASSPARNGFLKFTDGATPADLLTASMAAEPISIRVLVYLSVNLDTCSPPITEVFPHPLLPSLCVNKP